MIGGVGWNGARPIYPQSGPRFKGQTGRQLSSMYLFNEAAGNLIDVIGGANLVPANAPTYGYKFNARQGINYAAASSKHSADVADPGLQSMLAFVVARNATPANFASLMGRFNAGAVSGWGMFAGLTASGVVDFTVRDSAGTELTLATTATPINTALCMCSMQVDRAANLLRVRFASRGVPTQAIASTIAGFLTLSAPGQAFSFGVAPSLLSGAACFYAGFEIGASAAGVNALPDLHRSLGWT